MSHFIDSEAEESEEEEEEYGEEEKKKLKKLKKSIEDSSEEEDEDGASRAITAFLLFSFSETFLPLDYIASINKNCVFV